MRDRAVVTGVDKAEFRILRGMKDHLLFAPKLLEFRRAIGADDNASTDPAWFAVNSVDSRRCPVSVVMLIEGEVAGAVLFREQMRFGVGLGYLFACDAAGDEFILAEAGQHGECLRLCIYALLKAFPSWIVSIASRSDHSVDLGPEITYRATSSTAKYRLALQPSLDSTLSKFGSRTRRNLRYYARKLSKNNAVFHGALSDELGRAVATELLPNVDYPITERLLKETVAAVLRTPGHFFAGVQAGNGAWLSLTVGWRTGMCTKVLYQMNHRDFRKASLSLASRSFLIQHEIEQGSRELAFVSYTTGSIERAFNDDPRYDILAAKPSWRLSVVMWLATRFLHEGHRLRNLAKSNLQDDRGAGGGTLESFCDESWS